MVLSGGEDGSKGVGDEIIAGHGCSQFAAGVEGADAFVVPPPVVIEHIFTRNVPPQLMLGVGEDVGAYEVGGAGEGWHRDTICLERVPAVSVNEPNTLYSTNASTRHRYRLLYRHS